MFDLFKLAGELRNVGKQQKEIMQAKQDHPLETEVFESMYGLFSKYGMTTNIEKLPERLVWFCTTRVKGLSVRNMKCTGGIFPGSKMISFQNTFPSRVVIERSQAAEEFVARINSYLKVGCVNISGTYQTTTGRNCLIFEYEVNYSYDKAPLPPLAILDNMLRCLVEASDYLPPGIDGLERLDATEAIKLMYGKSSSLPPPSPTKRNTVYQNLLTCIDGMEIAYTSDSANYRLLINTQGQNQWNQLSYVSPNNYLVVETWLTESIPRERFYDFLEFSGQLNSKGILEMGHFLLDFDTFKACYRTGVDVRDAEEDFDTYSIQNVFLENIETANIWMPGVKAVMKGLSPGQVLTDVIQNM
jgi:hypothetical protein